MVASAALVLQPTGVRASAGDPVIKLYLMTDNTVYGYAYDPDDLNFLVEVVARAEGLTLPGVIAVAGYECPWPICGQDPNSAGHGFYIQYRRPVATWANLEVVAHNKPGTPGGQVFASKAGVSTAVSYEIAERFLYQNDNYKVGISRRYGAAITEYYNKRIAGGDTMNLVTSDNGAAIQTALFGDNVYPSHQIPHSGNVDCQGGTRFIWNPTQAGSQCRAADGGGVGSTIDLCTSFPADLCSTTVPFTESTGNGKWIQYRVFYRNFFYEDAASYPYKQFDDVRAYVKYTFFDDRVQVDWQIWRAPTDPQTNYGYEFQSLPTAFLTQMTQYSYSPSGTTVTRLRESHPRDEYEFVTAFNVGPTTGRWITAESVDRPGSPAVMTPGNHLTLAYYNSIEGCPARRFQMSFFEGNAFQQSSHAKNALTSYQPQTGTYLNLRGVIFPYKYNDILPGKVVDLATLVNTPSNGSPVSGYLPVNEPFLSGQTFTECNYP